MVKQGMRILLGIALVVFCFTSKASRAEAYRVQFHFENRKLLLAPSSTEIFSLPETTRSLKDPNSLKVTTFKGYPFSELLTQLKEIFKFKSLESIQFKARDGYVVEYPYSKLEDSQTFFVTDTPELKNYRVWNQSLKVNFDWRPGYILVNGASGTSPYQVTDIYLLEKKTVNPILAKTAISLQPGAKVFIKTCSKCHSLYGYGGQKGPNITHLTKLKPNDSQLKSFLRDPSLNGKRSSGMSAYKGSDSELNQLVRFLRSIEK